MSDARPVATDHLSLTLPDVKGAARKLRKRWPSKGVWWLLWTVYCVVLAVHKLTTGHLFWGVVDTFGAAFYWCSYIQRLPAFRGPMPRWWWMACGGFVAAAIVGVIGGWQ